MTIDRSFFERAVEAGADVALWPEWKRRGASCANGPIADTDILCAAIRRITFLISDLQSRQDMFPFPELGSVIEDLHAALSKAEEEYLPTCGMSPLERLAVTAEDDE